MARPKKVKETIQPVAEKKSKEAETKEVKPEKKAGGVTRIISKVSGEEKIYSQRPDEYMEGKCKVIGQNIRNERKKRKMSIESLAEYLELSSSYVGLLERGERCPSLKTFSKICDLFNGMPNDFISEKNIGTKLIMSENKDSGVTNKVKAINTLLTKLDESELEYVISMIKSLNAMKRKP